jgi:hypothetical protein
LFHLFHDWTWSTNTTLWNIVSFRLLGTSGKYAEVFTFLLLTQYQRSYRTSWIINLWPECYQEELRSLLRLSDPLPPSVHASRRVGCCYRLLRGAQTTALLYLGSRNIACCHVSLSPSCLIYVSRNQFRKGEGVDGGRSTQSSHRPILKAVKQHCALGGRGNSVDFILNQSGWKCKLTLGTKHGQIIHVARYDYQYCLSRIITFWSAVKTSIS